MSLLDELAEFIAHISFKDLSRGTVDKTELHIFDSLGALLAGTSSDDAEAARVLINKIVPQTGTYSVPIPGTELSAPLNYAAHISITAARMTETDDIDLSSCTTPGSVVVPTAILSAYYAGSGGKSVYEGILAGYDIMTRLGNAVKGPEIVYRGIWPTYLCGAMCAAAIGSRIFNLTLEQIKHALAISLTMSTGLSGNIMTGLTSRWLTLGSAVQNGLTAALAAEGGYAGDGSILDEPYASLFGLDMDAGRLLEGLGDKFKIEDVSLKPYCTARQALSPTEAFRWLLDNHKIDPLTIENIQVTVPEQYSQMINRTAFPEARVPSIVSVQYQIALTAYYEEGLYDLHRKNLKDTDKIRNLIQKIYVTTSPEYTSLYPQKWAGKITIKAGQDTYEHEILAPIGSPDMPMKWCDVEKKTKKLTASVLDPDKVEGLGAAVKTLKGCETLNDFMEHIPKIQLDH
ncbi:MAG: MmgE/PrpD family protein [Desulfobacterales bacterium]|nr:MmgE/PrpD family protein [Desulfobacterales bacterium]